METNKNQSRRSFIAALALGSSASAFPMLLKDLDAYEDFDNEEFNFQSDPKEWINKIKGSRRIVYDGSKFNNAFPIIWNWAFYQSNNDMGSPDSDVTAISVFRAAGIAASLNSSVWKKYALGAYFKIMDPQTGKPSERNFVYEPGSGDLLADVIDGIKELQGRGALFAVCNSAIRFHSARIAKKMNLKAAEVYKDLTSNILPQIQLVPTGVWAIGMAQEKKCGYIFAG